MMEKEILPKERKIIFACIILSGFIVLFIYIIFIDKINIDLYWKLIISIILFPFILGVCRFMTIIIGVLEKVNKNLYSDKLRYSDKSLTGKLKELEKLRDSGVFTDEEFKKKRKKVIDEF